MGDWEKSPRDRTAMGLWGFVMRDLWRTHFLFWRHHYTRRMFEFNFLMHFRPWTWSQNSFISLDTVLELTRLVMLGHFLGPWTIENGKLGESVDSIQHHSKPLNWQGSPLIWPTRLFDFWPLIVENTFFYSIFMQIHSPGVSIYRFERPKFPINLFIKCTWPEPKRQS